MMHGDRERQRRKAQQQVGKQPNDGSFDGAFGSRDFPPAHARALARHGLPDCDFSVC